ncbi:MAG: hypothetical protein OEW59_09080 [Gammaproteobacteria bacterium]|nr:hypothetical protein [Gammaproteobacteria bacterium]
MQIIRTVSALAFVLLPIGLVNAQDAAGDLAELRRLVAEMRSDYEARISDLESRLERAERAARDAGRDAEEAVEIAEEVAIQQSAGPSAPNTFNPAIGALINGGYADVDAAWDEIPGFQPGGEIGSGESGFSFGEAEINLQASVDTRYYGNLTLGLHSDEGAIEVGVEEAWVQTSDLPAGLAVTGGRFFSEAGYLNQFHFHADDFVDRPLPYQAFYGGRYSVDGVRARWLAPTALMFELGTELNWGGGFPATENGGSSPSAYTLYANLGGDIGDSHSWQIGLSQLEADAVDRTGGHAHEEDPGAAEPDAFTGDSSLTVFDFVWKWAPEGNYANRNFKVQGEYFSRSETGVFGIADYDGEQDGWYLQGVWQFAPTWRVGLRHDEVDVNNVLSVPGSELDDPGRRSHRNSAMVDWSPSEFSRLRLQYTRDSVLDTTDDQWYLQYIMSIGAHGAHQF